MDSRAFWAIVLSILVWLVWYRFLGPTQVPAPQQKQSVTSAPQPQPPAPTAAAPAPSLKLDLSTQKTWSIDNSVLSMKVIAQGARQSSLQLLNFKQDIRPNSPPMEMFWT